MHYLSICSGIEAASVAWSCLGWTPLAFSEIEPFPRAVLQHHYPDVPLHGDFTVLRDQPWIVDADVLVGGTPCQAFSVAGLRNSLSDDRGNLTLEFVRLANAIDNLRTSARREPAIIVWENVPGVLSVKDNAFGSFLAGLAGEDLPLEPPGGKWKDAGCVFGPQRAIAWRILDAQYFGLAQRRRRVFVVSSARDGLDPAAVLLEFEGVRRDTPPRRETRETASGGAGTGAAVGFQSSQSGVRLVDTHATLDANNGPRRHNGVIVKADASLSHWDDPNAPHPTLNQSHNTGGVGASNQELFSQRGAYLVEQPYTVANCLTARMHKGINSTLDEGQTPVVTHSLRAEGFDASEDGTGRGTLLVPVTVGAIACNTGPNGHDAGNFACNQAVDAGHVLPVTYSIMPQNSGKDYKAREVEVAQHGVAYPLDLRIVGLAPEQKDEVNRQGVGVGEDGDPMHTISTAFVPGVAYAFQPRIARNGRGDMGDLVNALNAQSGETGKGDAAPCVATINHGDSDASTQEANAIETLRALRDAVGAEAFAEWRLGILNSLQSPEVLRAFVHGSGIRRAAREAGRWVDDGAPSRPQDLPAGALLSLWEDGPDGRSSQGRELAQQLAGQLGQALPVLSSVGTQTFAVRRLTPKEAERLQGFTDNYTAIPWKKKPASECPDGPRYKALGNSMAVPVMRWIGTRIARHLRGEI